MRDRSSMQPFEPQRAIHAGMKRLVLPVQTFAYWKFWIRFASRGLATLGDARHSLFEMVFFEGTKKTRDNTELRAIRGAFIKEIAPKGSCESVLFR